MRTTSRSLYGTTLTTGAGSGVDAVSGGRILFGAAPIAGLGGADLVLADCAAKAGATERKRSRIGTQGMGFMNDSLRGWRGLARARNARWPRVFSGRRRDCW